MQDHLAWGNGEYGAWDCLNEAYGATVSSPVDWFPDFTLALYLRGNYEMPRIAELYARLPEVLHAYAGTDLGDGPTLCVARGEASIDYVVDRASDNCDTSCRTHDARHFSSSAAGEVTPLDTWDSTSGDPMPGWYEAICR